ncbi:Vacuolar protein sorting-associated protein 37B [Halotydeus destructor]|nr:Vacuolar protein sorting-associated protein 37B [Halotydeus destructor]
MSDSITDLLQHLSSDELKELLNDDGPKIEDMVKDSAQVKALESEREMLIASNKSLAEFNLSKEPTYQQLRQSLLDSYNEAAELKKGVEAKRDKLNDMANQTSLETTLALLQAAAAEAEEESDQFSEDFLLGTIPLESFLSSFLEKRKFAHLRRIKTEKLMEHVRSQNSRQQQEGPVRPAPAPPGSTGNPLPYPVVQHMPYPGYNNNYPFANAYPQ